MQQTRTFGGFSGSWDRRGCVGLFAVSGLHQVSHWPEDCSTRSTLSRASHRRSPVGFTRRLDDGTEK
eukprot:575950-Rhodomonas_salina.2